MTYEDIVKRGYTEFDNQPECEDFIRWAIDEIKQLRKNQCTFEGRCDSCSGD